MKALRNRFLCLCFVCLRVDCLRVDSHTLVYSFAAAQEEGCQLLVYSFAAAQEGCYLLGGLGGLGG